MPKMLEVKENENVFVGMRPDPNDENAIEVILLDSNGKPVADCNLFDITPNGIELIASANRGAAAKAGIPLDGTGTILVDQY